MIKYLNKIPIWVFGGILCGIIYFILFGFDELIISNTDWLMDNNDKGLAYLGTLFYVFSDWQFPLGLSDQLAYPLNYSIMYIDSIPLAAVISKIFLSFIGRTDFQYLGIVSFINQVLIHQYNLQNNSHYLLFHQCQYIIHFHLYI